MTNTVSWYHSSAVSQSHNLLYSIMRTAGVIQDRLETALEPTGLSLAKLGALRHLAEAEAPMQLGQLAERIACVKSNVTQLIDRLEAEGLVLRVPDPADRRSVRAAITDSGRVRLAAGLDALSAAETRTVADLEDTDLRTLHEQLNSLLVAR